MEWNALLLQLGRLRLRVIEWLAREHSWLMAELGLESISPDPKSNALSPRLCLAYAEYTSKRGRVYIFLHSLKRKYQLCMFSGKNFGRRMGLKDESSAKWLISWHSRRGPGPQITKTRSCMMTAQLWICTGFGMNLRASLSQSRSLVLAAKAIVGEIRFILMKLSGECLMLFLVLLMLLICAIPQTMLNPLLW